MASCRFKRHFGEIVVETENEGRRWTIGDFVDQIVEIALAGRKQPGRLARASDGSFTRPSDTGCSGGPGVREPLFVAIAGEDIQVCRRPVTVFRRKAAAQQRDRFNYIAV